MRGLEYRKSVLPILIGFMAILIACNQSAPPFVGASIQTATPTLAPEPTSAPSPAPTSAPLAIPEAAVAEATSTPDATLTSDNLQFNNVLVKVCIAFY